jgi:lysophospholipase L1-like esterase
VALGDSFASGVGASGATLDCGRSSGGWTGLLAVDLGMDFVNLACGGATLTETIEQASGLPSDTDVVAITAGGNSLEFSQVVILCVSGQCETGWDTAMANLSLIRPETLRLLEEIHRAAPGVSAIALTLYPPSTREGLTCGRVTEEVGSLFAQGTELLNVELLAAATDAIARGIPVVVVTPAEFADHTLCSALPWFHDFDNGLLVMHPNDAGHAALAEAARDALISSGN